MAKLKDKLWNWGHLEGSHNEWFGLESTMTPEQFAEEYDIRNAFMISFGGNIQPPYHNLAKRLSPLREIKWSILGDKSTPLPDSELGFTDDVIEASLCVDNITGGIVDDFFSPERLSIYTPDVLEKIHSKLNQNNLDFWCVMYAKETELELESYVDCFDGITSWIWKSEDIAHMETYFAKLKEIAKGKPIMLGVYLWDYENKTCIDSELFEKQLSYYFDLIKRKEIEGIIFCSNTIGDVGLETNQILKKYVEKYGDTEV